MSLPVASACPTSESSGTTRRIVDPVVSLCRRAGRGHGRGGSVFGCGGRGACSIGAHVLDARTLTSRWNHALLSWFVSCVVMGDPNTKATPCLGAAVSWPSKCRKAAARRRTPWHSVRVFRARLVICFAGPPPCAICVCMYMRIHAYSCTQTFLCAHDMHIFVSADGVEGRVCNWRRQFSGTYRWKSFRLFRGCRLRDGTVVLVPARAWGSTRRGVCALPRQCDSALRAIDSLIACSEMKQRRTACARGYNRARVLSSADGVGNFRGA